MQIEDDNYVYVHHVHQKDYIKNIDLLGIKDVVKVEKAPMKSSVNLIVCEQKSSVNLRVC
jgi:hypothetical protein